MPFYPFCTIFNDFRFEHLSLKTRIPGFENRGQWAAAEHQHPVGNRRLRPDGCDLPTVATNGERRAADESDARFFRSPSRPPKKYKKNPSNQPTANLLISCKKSKTCANPSQMRKMFFSLFPVSQPGFTGRSSVSESESLVGAWLWER